MLRTLGGMGALLSPWQWGLLGVAAGIVALYFLKLRRTPHLVPSTYLWLRAVEDLHVNSLFQKLRRNLLLVLQLLVIALVFTAFFPLSCATQKRAGQRYIFLIDNSASMAATDAQPSRLEDAKRQALALVDEMSDRDVGMVISFADSARVLASFTNNRNLLRQRIATIEQTQTTTSLIDALRAAAGLANPGADFSEQRQGSAPSSGAPPLAAEVYIFTDGRFPDVEGFSLGNLNPHFVTVGSSSRNLSIAAMSVRQNEEQPDQLQAFARVENFTSHEAACPVARQQPAGPADSPPADPGSACTCTPIETTAELSHDDQVIDAQQLKLRPGQSGPLALDLAKLDRGVLKLALDVDDDLAVDNVAWVALNPPRRARVLVVGADDNPFLDYCLRTQKAEDAAQIERRDPSALEQADYLGAAAAGRYDLVIYDRCSPKGMPQANTWFIGRLPPVEGMPAGTGVDWPVILDSDRSHPIMHYVGMDTVEIRRLLKIAPPQGAHVLVQADQGPAIFLWPREGFQDLVMTFELVSDGKVVRQGWHAHPSFPVFVFNVLRVLGSAGQALAQESVKPGRQVTLRSPQPVETVEIVSPDGQSHRVARTAQNTYVFHQTQRTGVYRVRWPNASAGSLGGGGAAGAAPELAAQGGRPDAAEQFTVNLFDAAESNIAPRAHIQIGHESVAAQSQTQPARRHLWKYFLLAALGVLVAEWYVYQRRVYF